MKIAINTCYGGFSVSAEVCEVLGMPEWGFGNLRNSYFNIDDENMFAYRSHPKLIKAIKKVGVRKAGGKFAKIKIVTIPDDINYTIQDYDGIETIHEVHRTWS